MDIPIKIEGIVYYKENGNYNFLLLKRVPEDGGFWQPLTESLEDGESIGNCITRGVKEELGINKIKSVTERIWSFPWTNKRNEPNIDLVYGVEIARDSTVTIDHSEHSEFMWFSYNEAIKKLKFDSNKNAFKYFKQKVMKK